MTPASFADGQAALFLPFLVAQLLPPGLDGEVGLALGDDFLGRVGILDDEVAGVAGHHHRLHRPLPAFADFDHFGDSNEMILHPLPAVETGSAGLLHDGFKVAVIIVAEHLGKVTAGPEFIACGIGAADGFKGRDFVAHGFSLGDRRGGLQDGSFPERSNSR
jgi:hypothetical protein